MKKKSIVRKLFIVTLAVFLGFFSIVMIAQGLFFERFYRSAKISELERNMNRFADQFNEPSGGGRVSRLLGTFMNENNASTAILNRHFRRIAVNPYFLELRTENKTVVIRFPS
ncbi:MAG: two-component sensor histidine kinase, partial [Paenibacillus sp.]|nr:two-component sensor histidine kinase [Paenibacillus sp.]